MKIIWNHACLTWKMPEQQGSNAFQASNVLNPCLKHLTPAHPPFDVILYDFMWFYALYIVYCVLYIVDCVLYNVYRVECLPFILLPGNIWRPLLPYASV